MARKSLARTLLLCVVIVACLVLVACPDWFPTGDDGDDGDDGTDGDDGEEPETPAYGEVGWNDLGIIDVTYAYECAIAIDPTTDKPVILIASEMEDYRAHAYTYQDGTGTDASWSDLGIVSTGGASWLQVQVMDDGTPVAAFQDGDNDNKAQAYQRLEGTWTSMGILSSDEVRYCCLATDPADGKPLLGFTEYSSGYRKARVLKWSSGSTWTDYGTASVKDGFFLSLAVDSADSSLYITFQDGNNGGKALVEKHGGGTAWDSLGVPSTGAVEWTDVVVDPADGKPIVAYKNVDYEGRATVRKWESGLSWGESLGIISTAEAEQIELDVDPAAGTPVAAFIDYDLNEQIHLLRYSDTTYWVDAGSPREQRVKAFAMAVDRFGRVFVVFNEYAESYQPRVFMYMW